MHTSQVVFLASLTIFGRKHDMNSQMTKGCRHFFLLDIYLFITTRGLRHHRYFLCRPKGLEGTEK
jgi:hypothetical protein